MRLSPTFRGFFLAILLISGIAALPPSSQWLNEATRYFNATWAGDTPADDQVWTYDSASGTVSWEDIPAAATGATELDELDDVTITGTPVGGEFIRHDGTTWRNSDIDNSDIEESFVTQHEGALTITESQISDLSHTTDTNANTICSGTTTYLDGEGNCDTLTDTNTFASIEEDGVAISTAAPTLDFDSSDFTIAESPTDSFDITINNSGIDHDATTNYVAAEHYDWTGDLGGPQINDANIASSSITQHEGDLTILLAQLSGGTNNQVIKNNSGTWEATDTISLAGNVNTGTYSASGASGGIALTPAGTTYASVAAASGSYLITANTSGLVHHMYSSGADAYLEATTGDLYLTSFAGSVVVPEGTVTAHEGALTITESQISDLSHTTDTNANTICSGSTTYLDGEGNCDTLTIDSFTPTTTKGDIIVENGSNAVRLAVGTNGQVLTADSAEATGIKWATPSAGGSTTLDGLSDVTITGTPADNELLAYDSGSSEFINQTASEAGVAAASHSHTFSDVTGGSDGDIVQNVSGTWTPGSSISVSGIIESGDYSSIGATSGTAHNANGNFFSSTSLTGTTHYIGTNTNGAIFNLASSGLDAFLTATQGDLNLVSTSGDVIVPEATVTAHEAALTITESQISDLSHTTDTFATVQIDGVAASTNAPTFDFDSGTFTITESPTDDFDIAVNEAGLSIGVSQLTGGSNGQVLQNSSGTWGGVTNLTLPGFLQIGTYNGSGASSGRIFNTLGFSQQSVTTTSSYNFERYYNPNGQVGSIVTSGSATSFNTSSDYRLKENEKPIESPVEKLLSIPFYEFNFKADPDERVMGVFAHELQEVLPFAVTGKKDAVNEDGTIDPQSVDYSKIVPLLAAAVQELSAKVERLEARQ